MTEQEWLNCTDPTPMLKILHGKISERKARLFACACCRRILHLVPQECVEWPAGPDRYMKALTASEQYADGLVTREIVREASLGTGGRYACDAISVTNAIDEWENALNTVSAWAGAALSNGTESIFLPWDEESGPAGPLQSDERNVHSQLMRDIFGNPFLHVIVDQTWLTSDVVTLAKGIYQDKAFDRLPILADALQDAGCDNADILNHCRSNGLHVRGCWVVDLLLGKE